MPILQCISSFFRNWRAALSGRIRKKFDASVSPRLNELGLFCFRGLCFLCPHLVLNDPFTNRFNEVFIQPHTTSSKSFVLYLSLSRYVNALLSLRKHGHNHTQLTNDKIHENQDQLKTPNLRSPTPPKPSSLPYTTLL